MSCPVTPACSPQAGSLSQRSAPELSLLCPDIQNVCLYTAVHPEWSPAFIWWQLSPQYAMQESPLQPRRTQPSMVTRLSRLPVPHSGGS